VIRVRIGGYVADALVSPYGGALVDLVGDSERARDLRAQARDSPSSTLTRRQYPEVAREPQRTYAPRRRQGFTVFFTGLSGAGKSTIAQVLLAKLLEHDDRHVRVLDGDLVRQHLSSELGFSKEHRDLNIRRIGFVASEITRCGAAALCAAIAPYDDVRKAVREMIEPVGGFVLVHVATPLAVCEQRDPKGLYAKARAGTLEHFTGISDPYEVPTDAEVIIHAETGSPQEGAEQIYAFLVEHGYLAS